MAKEKVSSGGLSGTIADCRLIFKSAIYKLASSIILVHNHPSGNNKPSQSDINLTKKMVEAGKLLDVSVLDHLIVAENRYFSFADEGLI
jgi:DNA repair protein RadC